MEPLKEKIFYYTLINLKQPSTFINEYRKLDWETAINLCLELNQTAKEDGDMPPEWESLYVVVGDE